MGLYNPVLGDIPQPQKDSNQVAFKALPTTNNYSAQVVTPLITEYVNYLVENTASSGVNSEQVTTDKDIILTNVFIQGYIKTSGSSSGSGYCDVYINGVKFFSINIYLLAATVSKEFGYTIPFQNVFLPKGTVLKTTCSEGATDFIVSNVAFTGYNTTKI